MNGKWFYILPIQYSGPLLNIKYTMNTGSWLWSCMIELRKTNSNFMHWKATFTYLIAPETALNKSQSFPVSIHSPTFYLQNPFAPVPSSYSLLLVLPVLLDHFWSIRGNAWWILALLPVFSCSFKYWRCSTVFVIS